MSNPPKDVLGLVRLELDVPLGLAAVAHSGVGSHLVGRCGSVSRL